MSKFLRLFCCQPYWKLVQILCYLILHGKKLRNYGIATWCQWPLFGVKIGCNYWFSMVSVNFGVLYETRDYWSYKSHVFVSSLNTTWKFDMVTLQATLRVTTFVWWTVMLAGLVSSKSSMRDNGEPCVTTAGGSRMPWSSVGCSASSEYTQSGKACQAACVIYVVIYLETLWYRNFIMNSSWNNRLSEMWKYITYNSTGGRGNLRIFTLGLFLIPKFIMPRIKCGDCLCLL